MTISPGLTLFPERGNGATDAIFYKDTRRKFDCPPRFLQLGNFLDKTNTMPNWSYIPYTSYVPKSAPAVGYHPAMAAAACRRIRRVLTGEFHVSDDKMFFLQRIAAGTMTNAHGTKAYMIVLEAFGKPLFVMRNLANTLQDPEDRGVYIVHLEEALHVWREREQTHETWWDTVLMLGIVGLAGAMTYSFVSSVEMKWPAIKPHALMGFFCP